MKRAVLILLLVLLASCERPDHVASFSELLSRQYGGVVPAAQQAALSDGLITPEEVQEAVEASLACMNAIDGVVIDEPFHWRGDGIEFGGGAHPVAGTNEAAIGRQMDACYYDHAALVETAWFDQEYVGSFDYKPAA